MFYFESLISVFFFFWTFALVHFFKLFSCFVSFTSVSWLALTSIVLTFVSSSINSFVSIFVASKVFHCAIKSSVFHLGVLKKKICFAFFFLIILECLLLKSCCEVKLCTLTLSVSQFNVDVCCISRCCLEVFVLTARLSPSLSSERNHPKRPDGGSGQRSDAGQRPDAELTRSAAARWRTPTGDIATRLPLGVFFFRYQRQREYQRPAAVFVWEFVCFFFFFLWLTIPFRAKHQQPAAPPTNSWHTAEEFCLIVVSFLFRSDVWIRPEIRRRK